MGNLEGQQLSPAPPSTMSNPSRLIENSYLIVDNYWLVSHPLQFQTRGSHLQNLEGQKMSPAPPSTMSTYPSSRIENSSVDRRQPLSGMT